MDDKRRADQAIPLLGLAAIIATSLGYYLWLEPLKTFRPPIGDPPKPPLERHLPARLWQDPIGEARRSYANSGSEVPQGQTEPIKLDPRDRLLLVQTSGGYSQLDYETRLRTRYAIGLALERAGFVPAGDDTEFLRFVTIPMGDEAPSKLTAKVVPYEYWNASPAQGAGCATEDDPRVIVLWVGDDISYGTPLQSMEDLVRKVTGNNEIPRPLLVIGPTSSGGLRALVEEVAGAPPGSPMDEKRFRVFSPWATADAVFLSKPGTPRANPPVVRTISNDRILAGALLNELELRKLDLRDASPDEIAVLAEWDTEYGRSLPVTFAACLQLREKQGLNCEHLDRDADLAAFHQAAVDLQAEPSAWPQNMKRVIYLRGLDGVGPRSGEGPGVKDQNDRRDLTGLERPDGSSQLDYARRLADKIAQPGKKRLRAVGVLGSDIYDKLLLLQALSERLPGVIFFTTDLDASFLHGSQLAWTRNLLVGSSYPLDLDSGVASSKEAPPLRDAYGPAVFYAGLLALKPFSCQAAEGLAGLQWPRKSARVFEVGRTGAHEQKRDERSWHQRLGHLWRFGSWLLLLLLVLPSLHVVMTGEFAWRTLLLLLLAISLFFGLYLALGREEPLRWIEGVSIWPSELCRLLAAALAVLFLARIRHGLAQNRALICQDFECESCPSWSPKLSAAWFSRLLAILRRRWAQPMPVRDLWNLYDEFDRPSYRYLRAGVLTAVSITVVWIARSVEAAPRPCRGESCYADTIVTFLALLSQFLLLYVVVDVTLACSRWIVALRDTRSRQELTSIEGYPEAWMEIELIARRTVEVSKHVLYPFLTLPLLILAQFSFFDRWSWPISLLVVYGGLLALALSTALILRRCAEGARTRACEEVRALRVQAIERHRVEQAARLESALREIESESRGAFSPLSQNPVLAAVLLPVSGAGTGLALDSLLKTL